MKKEYTYQSLTKALQNNHTNSIALHLKALLHKSFGKSAETIFHIAAKNGNVEVIDLFANAGADVNISTKNGESPLLYACHFQKKKAAQALIAYGANPNIVYTNNQEEQYSTLELVLKSKNKENIAFILENGKCYLSDKYIQYAYNTYNDTDLNTLYKKVENYSKALTKASNEIVKELTKAAEILSKAYKFMIIAKDQKVKVPKKLPALVLTNIVENLCGNQKVAQTIHKLTPVSKKYTPSPEERKNIYLCNESLCVEAIKKYVLDKNIIKIESNNDYRALSSVIGGFVRTYYYKSPLQQETTNQKQGCCTIF